jgi:GTPase SAR1 family protein
MLRNLRSLYLVQNKLQYLPPEMGQLPMLKDLFVVDNIGLTSPPPEVAAQGTMAVLEYLHGLLKKGSQQWMSKLLFVGEGGVGKTSTLRALRGEPFDSHEDTTQGIEVGEPPMLHPDIPDVCMRLKTWDFAGQTIQHATHQFFLTNRALFLLVWSARNGWEQGKLYYWLETIQARRQTGANHSCGNARRPARSRLTTCGYSACLSTGDKAVRC